MNRELLLEAASSNLNNQYCETLEYFKYTPLKDGEIRILKILPGERGSALKCQICHEKLAENPNYGALSYTWGRDPVSLAINVDQKRLLVTHNLHAGLLELRADFSRALCHDIGQVSNLTTAPKGQKDLLHLWVDAICINQEDKLERQQQVSMMGKIYESAARLYIWLGSAQDDSDLAIAFIVSIAGQNDGGRAKVNMLAENMGLATYVKTCQAVATFLARGWFYRAWIIQEYAMAADEDTTFYCGTSRMSVDEMKSVNLAVMETPTAASVDTTIFGALAAASLRWSQLEGGGRLVYRHKIRMGNTNTLLRWLVTNRTMKATDERDKIYSVLGLGDATHYDPNALIVDYDTSIQDVYSSVVKSVISASKRLNILGACAERGKWIQRTWTPDWAMPSRSHFSTLGVLCGEQNDHEAGFSAAKNSEAIVDFAHDLTTLTIRGLLWDVVYSSTHEVTMRASLSPAALADRKIFYQATWAHFNHRCIYESERAAKASLWRTLLFRCVTFPNKVPDLDLLGFEEGLRSRFTTEEAHRLAKSASNPEMARLASDRTLHGEESCWYTEKLLDRLQNEYRGGELLITEKGYMGKAYNHSKVKEGDLICILLGSDVPIVLRAVGDHHELVGDAYIDGIMHGEAMEALEMGNIALQDFVLH